MLCVSSDKQTVHLFRLDKPTAEPSEPAAPASTASSWGGYLLGAVTAAASYLPSTVTSVWSQGLSESLFTHSEVHSRDSSFRMFSSRTNHFVLHVERSFVQFQLPHAGAHNICAFANDSDATVVYAVTDNGYLRKYHIERMCVSGCCLSGISDHRIYTDSIMRLCV